MPVQIDSQRRLQMTPADVIPVKEIREALEKFHSSRQAATVAAEAVTKLERESAGANAADLELRADFIEAGKGGDPGTPNADAHREALDAASLHAQACRVVQDRAFAALLEAFEDHGAELETKVQADFDSARATYLDAVDEVDARRTLSPTPRRCWPGRPAKAAGSARARVRAPSPCASAAPTRSASTGSPPPCASSPSRRRPRAPCTWSTAAPTSTTRPDGTA